MVCCSLSHPFQTDVPDVSSTRPDGTAIPIFSESLNPSQIQKDWVDSNGIVVVDNLLSKESLELIQQKVLWESTVSLCDFCVCVACHCRLTFDECLKMNVPTNLPDGFSNYLSEIRMSSP